MPKDGPWAKPVPAICITCGGTEIEGLGPYGHWHNENRGGLLYAACCRRCNTRWIGHGWGGMQNLQILRWEKEKSAEQ